MEAQAIIDQMLKRYRELSTYQDLGYVIVTDYLDTKNETVHRLDFATSFKRCSGSQADRKHLFRFQWRNPHVFEPDGEWNAAIWSNGESVFEHYPATGTKSNKSISSAIAQGASALSAGSADKALLLLMPGEIEKDCAHHFPPDGFEKSSIEPVFSESCYRLRRTVANRALTAQSLDLWVSVDRCALLKTSKSEIVDHVRFDAWHQGLLGDDPVENELIVEEQRQVMRIRNQRMIREREHIEDWRRKGFELSSEPCPKITEIFYTQVRFDCPIADELKLFGTTFRY